MRPVRIPARAPADAASGGNSGVERKLAAILAADVHGYSRMMHVDEEGTLSRLTAMRAAVDPLILQANGEIFGSAGDSVLAEFPSVVEALHCAVAIQRTLTRFNEALPDDERMLLRMGINVGDVMVKDGNVFGDGVNIAARIEAMGEPGQICVSRAARDQLRDRVDDIAFADLGEHSVKNIERPVRVFRVTFDRHAEPVLPDSVRRSAPAPEPTETPPEDGAPRDSVEIAFWQSVQASDDDAEYSIYLERYPGGAFAELARARVADLSSSEDVGVELAFWKTVRTSNDAAMLQAYLDKYPRGEFRSLAEIMLAKLIEKG